MSKKQVTNEQLLVSLLSKYPELMDRLIQALVTQQFMITIHYQKVLPGVKGDLQHWLTIEPSAANFLIRQNYLDADIKPKLEKIARSHCDKIMELVKDIGTVHIVKNDATAETKDAKGWV